MEAERNKKSFLIIGFLVLLVILSGVFYYLREKSNSKKIIIDELPYSKQLQIAKYNEIIKVPEISKETSVAFTSLPQYIQDLFADRKADFLVKSLVYKDGTSGFSIEYVSEDSVRNNYVLIHKNSKTPWPPLYGSRTKNSAVLNIDHSSYLIVAEFTEREDMKTMVKVYVLNK